LRRRPRIFVGNSFAIAEAQVNIPAIAQAIAYVLRRVAWLSQLDW
jgi:hypothetical protein